MQPGCPTTKQPSFPRRKAKHLLPLSWSPPCPGERSVPFPRPAMLTAHPWGCWFLQQRVTRAKTLPVCPSCKKQLSPPAYCIFLLNRHTKNAYPSENVPVCLHKCVYIYVCMYVYTHTYIWLLVVEGTINHNLD